MISGKVYEKKKGDIYIGIIASESNPPNIFELETALRCIGECLIDKIYYAVTDGESPDNYFVNTRSHRLAMADIFSSLASPFIETADLGDNKPMPGEDMSFSLFGLNRELRFTLFFISQTNMLNSRIETVKRLLTNISTRLYGFNVRKHRVVALFTSKLPVIDEDEQLKRYKEEELFEIMYLEESETGKLRNSNTGNQLLEILDNPDKISSPVFPASILKYIFEHEDYRLQLRNYLLKNIK